MRCILKIKMSKLPMYIIMAIFMGIGGFAPTLFGESPLGGWSIFGTLVGGIIGVIVYWKVREAGYIE